MSRSRLAACAATTACCAMAAAGVALAGDDAGGTTATCEPVGLPAATGQVEKVVNGLVPLPLPGGGEQDAAAPDAGGAQQGKETTTYFEGGVYRVTRCDAAGQLVVSQMVAPVPVPGNQTVMAPVSWSERLADGTIETTHGIYGDANHPGWAAECRKHEASLRARVIPPTAEGR